VSNKNKGYKPNAMSAAFKKASEESGIPIRDKPLSSSAINAKSKKKRSKSKKRLTPQQMEAQFLKKHAKASQRKRYETDYKPKQTQQAHTVHIDEKPDELPTVEVVRETVEQQKHFRPSRSRHSQLKELTRIKDFDSFPLADFAPNPTLHPSIQQQSFHQISSQCSNEFLGEDQVFETFTNETDVVIGIDFGTATTKVVVNVVGTRAYAVPFSNGTENDYLISSAINCHDDIFDLFTDSSNIISGLKQPILDGDWSSDRILPALAFLANVVNYSKAWFLEHKADELPGAYEFHWHVHLGIPAADYSDKELIHTMERLRFSAEKLASINDQLELKRNDVARIWESTERLKVDVHGVYPEVAAQLHGFVYSNRFDRARPKIMLIDIGGGTVDCTVANITEDDDGLPVINTLATNVQPLGVNSLSQYRLKWLRKSANEAGLIELVSKIDNVLPLAGISSTVPESITDYIDGLLNQDWDIDKPFYGNYADQLTDHTLFVAHEKDGTNLGYEALQVIVSGGGSNLKIYQQFIEKINRQRINWLHLMPLRLGTPSDFIAPRLDETEYHRLSVAFGLSDFELSKYVSPSKIIPTVKQFNPVNEIEYISKDHV
jgi:hypothetical protein